MPTQSDVSVVIVSFNAKDRLESCLFHLFRSETTYNFDVWVVDNASADGAPQMVSQKFPTIHLIANIENVGYSKANNQAIRQCRGRYVLLLNPDVEVQQDTLQKT